MKIIINVEDTPVTRNPDTVHLVLSHLEVTLDGMQNKEELLDWLEQHIDHSKTIYHSL